MTKYKVGKVTLFCSIVTVILAIFGATNHSMAEEFSYKYADDVVLTTTFLFRDGIETPKFTEFKMGEDYTERKFASFELQGIIGQSPLFHKALDDAYKYRNSGSFEWDMRYFDVLVNFSRNGETIQEFDYDNCEIDSYHIDTENDDYESYTSSSSGFAVIDVVELDCGGVKSLYGFEDRSHSDGDFTYAEFDPTPFEFDRDTRTWITFEFDNGIEKIEFPIFALNSGYEDQDNTVPQFTVQGLIMKHPLLNEAIERSRLADSESSRINVDFDATVEFISEDKILRGFDFSDCRVIDYLVFTSNDNEEPYTGKSGFANVEEIEFQCYGLKGINPEYNSLMGKSWQVNFIENVLPIHEYRTPVSSHAITTFTFKDGSEVIDFPFFENNDVMQRETEDLSTSPQFVVQGPVESHPLLFKRTDESLKITSSGSSNALEKFQVDVSFVYGDEVIRGLNYSKCRVIDYAIKSETSGEETYFKKMATTQIYTFECDGYTANNPLYDAMFTVTKASTTSSVDLKETSDWGPGFTVK